jgi:uncharacterized RDD family membrane protein YckC
MTNAGGTPAGWYYAPGDPEGTQRYWDGAQWIGDPQAIQQQPPAAAPTPDPAPAPTPDPAPAPAPDYDQTVQYQPPPQQASPPPGGYQAPAADAGAAPNYAAPGAAPGGQPGYQQPPAAYAAPQGYQNYGAPGVNVGVKAEWGTRAIALLIDWGIGVGIFLAGIILALIAGAIADTLGGLMIVITYVAAIAYWVWNMCIRQGSTGQSIGKEKQGIKLVKDETGQPVGGGMAFVRYIIASLLSSFTCGIYGLLDYLWPLWDEDKTRLTDKLVKMSVVQA